MPASMRPPDPEITPAERYALNSAIARSDATGFRDAIPKCQDFEYLHSAVVKAGWIMQLTVGDFIEKPRDSRPGRRSLGSIRLKRNKTAAARVAVPVADDLALASRIALDRFLTEVKT